MNPLLNDMMPPISDQLLNYFQKECNLAIDHQKTPNELVKLLYQHIKQKGMQKNAKDHRLIYLDKSTTDLFRIDLEQFVSNGGRLSDTREPIIVYANLINYIKRLACNNI